MISIMAIVFFRLFLPWWVDLEEPGGLCQGAVFSERDAVLHTPYGERDRVMPPVK